NSACSRSRSPGEPQTSGEVALVPPVFGQSPLRPDDLRILGSLPSPHRGNDKLGTFLGTGRPARRYGFDLGVEPDRVWAMLVEVTEARTLPSAEAVVCYWSRNGEIHSYHANIDARGELARGVAVAGEDGAAVAVVMLGRQLHGFLVVLGPHYAEYRAEDLLLVDAHVRRHFIEQAAAHEVAVF